MSIESKHIRLFDKSRSSQDWRCPRSRYWQYEHGGTGIVPNVVALELFLGITIHDALAAIATQQRDLGSVDIDLIASTSRQSVYTALLEDESDASLTYANEQASLVEGLIRVFYRHCWPALLAQYPTIVSIEEELLLPLGESLVFMSKPDLVLADQDGETHIIEYKSSSTKKPEWVESWNTAVQSHAQLKVQEYSSGQAPADLTVIGLYKGYYGYGRQQSQLCYGYVRPGKPPFTKPERSYEYKAGFYRTATWEMEGGVKAWVEAMPAEVMSTIILQTPPIFVKDEMIDSFFRQRAIREQEIEMAMEMMDGADDEVVEAILDTAFEQKFEACRPAYGSPCAYLKLCFGPKVDPLENGFQRRVSHHEAERLQQEAQQAEPGESSAETD